MWWIIFVVSIMAFKFFKNLTDMNFLKKRFADYERWNSQPSDQLSQRVLQTKSQTIKLLEDAGVKSPHLPIVQPMGYGQLASFSASAYLNYPSQYQDLVIGMLSAMQEGIGVYKTRMFDAVNPFYWIKAVVYLPVNALKSIGINHDSVLSKILQGLYWIVITIGTSIWLLFKPQVIEWIQQNIK